MRLLYMKKQCCVKIIKVNDNISAKCYAGTDKLEDIMESTEKEVFECLDHVQVATCPN